ncbi:MAG: Imm74 family immunity protein [Saprospiraceae bacterium]
MIKEITRGHITLETSEGVVRILGEALLPGFGSPDFVVYENSIKEWIEPEKKAISEESKKAIIEQLIKDAKARKLKIEIE